VCGAAISSDITVLSLDERGFAGAWIIAVEVEIAMSGES
jgi:hypothetical protein